MKVFFESFSESNLGEIFNQVVKNENIVVLKDFISADKCLMVRDEVFNHFSKMPQRVDVNYDNPSEFNSVNFWKFERGVSANQKSLHSFKSYFVNDIDGLPNSAANSLKEICGKLFDFHAKLVMGNLNHATQKYRPQLIQYHKGGGFFSAHVHPFEPMKVGIVLSLSRKGDDYLVGGSGFENSRGEITSLSGEHDLGDLCLFKYSLKHWVLPTDPDDKISHDNDGRWSLVVPIY